MLRFILGGVALAVTGYGVKKYFEDETNCQEFDNSVCNLIDKAEEKTDKFFDYANEKIDELDEKRNGKRESCDEDELCDEVEEVQNDKQSDNTVLLNKIGLLNDKLNKMW